VESAAPLGSLNNRVQSFKDFRELLLISHNQNHNYMAKEEKWSCLMKGLGLCGYHNGSFRDFVSDLQSLTEREYFNSVPPGITQPARAMLSHLVDALAEWGVFPRQRLGGVGDGVVATQTRIPHDAGMTGVQPKASCVPNKVRRRITTKQRPQPVRAQPKATCVPNKVRRRIITKRRPQPVLMERGHYDVLGLLRSATPAEIRLAYRQKALLTHPDKGGCPDGEPFRKVIEAFQVLSESDLRDAYHRELDSRGCSDGIGAEQLAAQAMNEIDEAKATRAAARMAHLQLLADSPATWPRQLAAIRLAVLENLSAWLKDCGKKCRSDFARTVDARSAGISKVLNITKSKNSYRAEIQFSGLIARTGYTKSLAQAIDWHIALVHMKSKAHSKVPTVNSEPSRLLTMADLRQALNMEPDMQLRFGCELSMSARRIHLPMTTNLESMLTARSSIEALSGTSYSATRLKLAVNNSKRKLCKEREELQGREKELAIAVALELEARKNERGGAVGDGPGEAQSWMTSNQQSELLKALGTDPESYSSMMHRLRSLPRQQLESWTAALLAPPVLPALPPSRAPEAMGRERTPSPQCARLQHVATPVAAVKPGRRLASRSLLKRRRARDVAGGVGDVASECKRLKTTGTTPQKWMVECELCKAWREVSEAYASMHRDDAKFHCKTLNLSCKPAWFASLMARRGRLERGSATPFLA